MQNPKLKIKLDTYDKVLEILGAAALMLIIMLPFNYFGQLPEVIPSHFNAMGMADSYSSKAVIFVLPSIGFILYMALHTLNRYPHIFNYPKTITTENIAQQYRAATKLIRLINTIIILAFTFITYATILTALDLQSGIPSIFQYIFLGSLLGSFVLYFLNLRNVF